MPNFGKHNTSHEDQLQKSNQHEKEQKPVESGLAKKRHGESDRLAQTVAYGQTH